MQSALERLCVAEHMITASADTRFDVALAVPSEDSVELSIVMPCLNEAETLENCIRKAQRCLNENDIQGEIIIADNGSGDGSQEIARRLGARVVSVSAKGYGNALMGGIQAARAEYVVMGDADDSYDFTNLVPFLKKLREGDDLVMGNRFRGGIKPGAMPPLQRWRFSLRAARIQPSVDFEFGSARHGDGVCHRDGSKSDALQTPHRRGAYHAFS